MSHPVRTADPTTTAEEAATETLDREIGSIVVVEDDAVVGIVTHTDLVRLLASTAEPRVESLDAFMSADVITIDPSATVLDAASRMFENGISRLVVVEDGEPIGVISTNDIMHHLPQVYQRRSFERPSTEIAYRFRQETAYDLEEWNYDCLGCEETGVSVGDRATFEKRISEADVRAFATASGDTNRLHLDDAYATQTRFGRRIVHGTLVGGLISAALARLPGVTIYLSQDLSFLAPVDIGDRVTAVCEVVENLGDGKYHLTTDVFDEDEDPCIEGQAVVLIDEPPEIGHVDVEAVHPSTA